MTGQFLSDVLAQPEAIEATAEALLADATLLAAVADLRRRHRALILTGMGSSHTALYPLHLRLLAAGLPAVLVEAGELLHYAADGLGPDTGLVVVSQSGETVEVVRLLERLGGRAAVLGVTNDPASTLARRADVAVVLRAGVEGIVATRTYVATLAALSVVGTALLGQPTAGRDGAAAWLRRAAAANRRLVDRSAAVAERVAAALGSADELFLIGRGPSFASALTGALILKEASHTSAEPLSGGHFRHGPLEMVSERTGALLFAPRGRTGQITRRLAAEIAGYGGRALLVGPAMPDLPGADLPRIDTGRLDEELAPFAEIVVPELLAERLARARGHEPGVFRRMGKVTREE